MPDSILVLRDVPKQQVNLDLLEYSVQGGFRGFDNVPAGFHALAVLKGETFTEPYWFFSKPGQVIVLRFSAETGELEEDTPENISQFTQLARSGAMSQALYRYSDVTMSAWAELTGYIALKGSIPTLNMETIAADEKRLTAAFERTHGGDVNAFIAELQFSFIRWWIHVSLSQADDASHDRWIYLLNALYNSGEFTIRDYPALFLAVVPILLIQLAQLPDELFAANSAFTAHASYLAEDLIDTEQPDLVAQGKKLRQYLESRLQ